MSLHEGVKCQCDSKLSSFWHKQPIFKETLDFNSCKWVIGNCKEIAFYWSSQKCNFLKLNSRHDYELGHQVKLILSELIKVDISKKFRENGHILIITLWVLSFCWRLFRPFEICYSLVPIRRTGSINRHSSFIQPYIFTKI